MDFLESIERLRLGHHKEKLQRRTGNDDHIFILRHDFIPRILCFFAFDTDSSIDP